MIEHRELKPWELTTEDIRLATINKGDPDRAHEGRDNAIVEAAVKKALDFALRGPHMVATGNDGSDVLCIECGWISTMRQEVGL